MKYNGLKRAEHQRLVFVVLFWLILDFMLCRRLSLTTTTFNIFCTFYIDNILFGSIQHLFADGVMGHAVVGGITLEVHPLKRKIKNFIKILN